MPRTAYKNPPKVLFHDNHVASLFGLSYSQGTDVNATTRFEQRTPLHAATKLDRGDVVVLLLGSGADANRADIYGGTALHLAAHAGSLDVVELLLRHGADVNLADNEGWTALHLAAECGRVDAVRLLLERHARIDCQNRYGRTPLHWACASNQVAYSNYTFPLVPLLSPCLHRLLSYTDIASMLVIISVLFSVFFLIFLHKIQ